MHKGFRARWLLIIGLTVLLGGSGFIGTRWAAAQNENAVNRPGADRLEAARLRVCQNREAAINRIMTRMANRMERIQNVFSAITERVEAFYARRGLTVGNYDALVADVAAKKSAAEAQVAALQNNTPFSCADDNPRGLATAFKDQLRATRDALKDYKTAVKNLIVGVKSAQGQVSSNQNSNAASNTNTE